VRLPSSTSAGSGTALSRLELRCGSSLRNSAISAAVPGVRGAPPTAQVGTPARSVGDTCARDPRAHGRQAVNLGLHLVAVEVGMRRAQVARSRQGRRTPDARAARRYRPEINRDAVVGGLHDLRVGAGIHPPLESLNRQGFAGHRSAAIDPRCFEFSLLPTASKPSSQADLAVHSDAGCPV
jgi:hypothetical protein